MEEEKKDLISREIGKFRDQMKVGRPPPVAPSLRSVLPVWAVPVSPMAATDGGRGGG